MKSNQYFQPKQLIDEYTSYAQIINISNAELLNSNKKFLDKHLKCNLKKALVQHTEYVSLLERLEIHFIGEIENYYHTDLALLSIKNVNQEAVSRARNVFITSLQRFETTLSSIEDSIKFNRTLNIAKLSIFIAIIPTIVSISEWCLNYFLKIL